MLENPRPEWRPDAGISVSELCSKNVALDWSEAGSVESVKTQRTPATMSDAVRTTMGLSAAKARRFRPAMKDGEPVRYRDVIWVLKN